MTVPGTMRILAGGDVMLGDSSHFLGRGVGSHLARGGAGSALAAVRHLFSGCDLFFANLESPLSSRPRRGSWERVYVGASGSAAVLAAADRNVVSVANNHILEHGWPLLEETRAALESAGVACAGYSADGGRDGAVHRWQQNGLELSLVADSHVREFWRRGRDPREDIEWLVAAIRAESPRVTLVSLHWGDEYVDRPSPGQRALARRLVEAGAVLVLGHHPHVLQPVERIGRGLVAYSLGNLLFDQDWSPATRGAGLLDVTLGADGVVDWSFHPTTTGYGGRVAPAVGREADVLRSIIHGADFPAGDDYAVRLAAAARRHRVLMKAELLRHLPRVRAATWHFLLTKRRRPRPEAVRGTGEGS